MQRYNVHQRAGAQRPQGRLPAGEAVTTVAFDLNYSNPAAFTAMFRKLVGASPTAYRRAAS